ncbi:hypothetical protein AA14337_3390 [Acetobacter malorum DSM 14337]|uniref:Nucleotidyl transferase AbiEii/AbiGii toxin family protein n=1 Tax=Acetobacter malorum DSM 14337 TaxID=1307910 RepID=A0ABQ0Q188_9PROT|nr:nucleotidyl transferase AbiEii/AbiGii toxin family protein [Acetobacter malorum]GBQ86693.1 hypothetical protein AA14337_3390 [Acetobacter malorum DSM 14337]
MSHGSKRWPASIWLQLLPQALTILDEGLKAGNEWSFGGGTALALHLKHRISYDIDIFLHSGRVRDLTPYKCEATKRILGDRKFQYPGNYLKLELQGGEIDFLQISPLTDDPYVWMSINGREVPVETPSEIIAKKIAYRSSEFKLRDIFDLSCALRADPDFMDAAIPELSHTLPLLKSRLEFLIPVYEAMILNEVNPLPGGRASMSKSAIELCLEATDGWINSLSPVTEPPDPDIP